MDFYCNDRSAEYERKALKEGGSLEAKQCLLYGTPELAAGWLKRCFQFFPEHPGGLMGVRPQNGWSFIRIPGRFSPSASHACFYAPPASSCYIIVSNAYYGRLSQKSGKQTIKLHVCMCFFTHPMLYIYFIYIPSH